MQIGRVVDNCPEWGDLGFPTAIQYEFFRQGLLQLTGHVGLEVAGGGLRSCYYSVTFGDSVTACFAHVVYCNVGRK